MKGYLGNYIILIIMLGLFSFMFIALNEAYTMMHTWTATAITDADSINTVSILNIIWVWFPVAVLLSYMVYSIGKAQHQKEVWP